MAVDQRLGQNLCLRDVIKALLENVLLHLLEVLNVLAISQLVQVDTMGFMTPQPHNLSWSGHTLIGGEEETLEDVGQVTEVEDVMELDCSGHEHLGCLEVKTQGSIDHIGAHFPDQKWEFVAWSIQVIRQDGVVNAEERIMAWEADSKSCKMSLQSWVDGETSSCGIHAGNVLTVVDVLGCQLVPVIPMVVIQMLPDQSVRLDSSISVHFRHVHVIQEINQFLVAWWSKVLASLLLQRLLQDLLEHFRGVVVVERDIGDHVVLVQLAQFLIDQDSFSTSCTTHQHHRMPLVHQHVQEVLDPDSLSCMNKNSLKWKIWI